MASRSTLSGSVPTQQRLAGQTVWGAFAKGPGPIPWLRGDPVPLGTSGIEPDTKWVGVGEGRPRMPPQIVSIAGPKKPQRGGLPRHGT